MDTSEMLIAQLAALNGRIARIEELMQLVPLLLAHIGDATHVSVPQAAQLLRVSTKTIRRRIAAGQLTLEVIPGTRRSGVPVDQLYSGWISLAVAKSALQRELASLKRTA